MRKLRFEAPGGHPLTGYLPESWAEVPFRAYVTFAATARPLPACITQPTAHAFAHPAGCAALAALLGLPTAEPLQQDVRQLVPIYEAAPWLFDGSLPLASELVTAFTHQGTRYRYAPAAELGPDLAAARQRVLLWYLREADGNVLACAPHLLATLYTPHGSPPTAANGEAGIAAFETLPVSVVWPCLLHFLLPASLDVNPVERYLALRPMLTQALRALEAAPQPAQPAQPAPPSPSRWRRWLNSVWRPDSAAAAPALSSSTPQ